MADQPGAEDNWDKQWNSDWLIHVNPLKHVMGSEQCRPMTHYLYPCIKPQQTWSTLFILQVHMFSCDLTCHSCLGRSISNPHSQVHPGRMYILSGSGTLWSPNSCHFESYQPNAFGITPMFDSLQDWGLCLLILLLPSVILPSPSSFLETFSRICAQSWFPRFDKDSWVPVQRPNHCFFILSMTNARFGVLGQYH